MADKKHLHQLLDQLLDTDRGEAVARVLEEMATTPTLTESLRKYRVPFRGGLSFGLVVASIVIAWRPGSFWEAADPLNWHTQLRGIVLAFWAVVPPLWFLIEYSAQQDDPPTKIERLKYLQDLSAKVWAGIVAALAVLYFGKDIFHH